MLSWEKLFFEPKLMSQTTFFSKQRFNLQFFDFQQLTQSRTSRKFKRLSSQPHSHRKDSSQCNVHNLLFWEKCCLRHQFCFKKHLFSGKHSLPQNLFSGPKSSGYQTTGEGELFFEPEKYLLLQKTKTWASVQNSLISTCKTSVF